MNMTGIRFLVIAAAMLPLLACGNDPDYAAQDDATCRKSSDPGSEEYRLCRQALTQKREAESKFRVWIGGQVRRVTAAIRREMKRRAAVEPMIGHRRWGEHGQTAGRSPEGPAG